MAAPFRLLDLPQEFIDKIFDAYFEETSVRIDFRRGATYVNDSCKPVTECSTRKTQAVPNLAIFAVSRKVLKDSRAAFCRRIDNTILVNVSKLDEEDRKSVFHMLSKGSKYGWLRQFTEKVVIQYEEGYWNDSLVDWREFIHAFTNLHQVRVTTVSTDFLNWSEVQLIVETLLKREFPTAELADLIFTKSDMMNEIARALEQRLGPGGYEASCFARHMYAAHPPPTRTPIPGCFMGQLSARFVQIPGKTLVCDMADTFLQRYSRWEKMIADADEEDSDDLGSDEGSSEEGSSEEESFDGEDSDLDSS